MEYDQNESNQEGTFWSRLKESPRTVSVLIVILIVAAAIYAFSDSPPEQEATDELIAVEETGEAEEGGTEEEIIEDTTPRPETVSPDALAEQQAGLPEGTRTEATYVETAQRGDGITHLARRAATRYVNENEVGYALTNEHRIYIEDYIQKRIGSHGLALGEEVTISFELVQEAVAAAGNLTPAQLQNLSQYTHVLR